METSELEKGVFKDLMPTALLGAAVGTIIANTSPQNPPTVTPNPMVSQTAPGTKKWSNKGLHPDLHPIAQLESSSGKFINHAPHSGGPWTTAFGALGFKPQTAYEAYLKDRNLKTKYPNLKQDSFYHKFTNDPEFYNETANSHWEKLKAKVGGDVGRAAFGWRWGRGASLNSPVENAQQDPYVQNYLEMHGKTNVPKVVATAKSETGSNEIGRASYGPDYHDFNQSHETKIYASFGPDTLQDQLNALANTSSAASITDLHNKLATANEVWKSFCLRTGGQYICDSGPEAVGRVALSVDAVIEIADIKAQYESALGGTVCVGIGKTIQEADRALLASELRGVSQITLYTEITEREIQTHQTTELSKASDEEKAQAAKDYDFTHQNTHKRKTKAHRVIHWQHRPHGGFHGKHAGFAHPKAPAPPELNEPMGEASEHSPGENAKDFTSKHPNEAPGNETDSAAAQLENDFAQAAEANKNSGPQTEKSSPDPDAVKAKVVEILQSIKTQAPALEKLKATAPEAYKSVTDLISGIIEMARAMKPEDTAVPVKKNETANYEGIELPNGSHDYTGLLDPDLINDGYQMVLTHNPHCVVTVLQHGDPVTQLHPPTQFNKAESDWYLLFKNEEFLNQIKEAGFLHKPSGTIYSTGPFHDINRLPTEYDDSYEDGFVTHGGEFVTRAMASAALGVNRPVQSEEIFHQKALLEVQDLQKAFKDLPKPTQENSLVGTWHKRVEKRPHFDYSHLLDPNLRDDGYRVYVFPRNYDQGRPARAVVNLSDAHHGTIYGGNVTEDNEAVISPNSSKTTAAINVASLIHNPRGQTPPPHDEHIVKLFQERGLGTKMYEALFHHLQTVGITHISGLAHSSSAHKAHMRLKAMHNTNYNAKPNIDPNYKYKEHEIRWMQNGYPPDVYQNQTDWENIKDQPFDSKWSDYKYAIKSETEELAKKLPMPSPIQHRNKIPTYARTKEKPVGATRTTKQTVHTQGGRTQIKIKPYNPDGTPLDPKWVMASSSVVRGPNNAPISPKSKNKTPTQATPDEIQSGHP